MAIWKFSITRKKSKTMKHSLAWIALGALVYNPVAASKLRRRLGDGIEKPVNGNGIDTSASLSEDPLWNLDWTNWGWPSDAPAVIWSDAIGPFGQCGGAGYGGNVTCVDGWTCVPLATAYAQCLPSNSTFVINGTISTSSSSSSSSSSSLSSSSLSSSSSSSGSSSSSSSGSTSSSSSNTMDTLPPLLPDEPTTDDPTMDAPTTDEPMSGTPADSFQQTHKIGPWLQCGGKGFDYSPYIDGQADASTRLNCIAGYQCDVLNEWFFQCVLKHDPLLANLWSQCGGEYHVGSTTCIEGSYCKYFNSWYSQCLPIDE